MEAARTRAVRQPERRLVGRGARADGPAEREQRHDRTPPFHRTCILHGVLPEVAPTFVSLSLYRFDVNIRSGTVLGAIGAGGIGFLIYNSIQLFQYRELTTELIVTLVLVLAVERLSTLLRARIA